MYATIPSWEEPLHRFLSGEAELKLDSGVFVTVWDAVQLPERQFPITLEKAFVDLDRDSVCDSDCDDDCDGSCNGVYSVSLEYAEVLDSALWLLERDERPFAWEVEKEARSKAVKEAARRFLDAKHAQEVGSVPR